MKINFANPDIGNFEKKNILDAFSTKWISQGPYNKKFEDKFAKILNRKFALSVSNGTAAVQLAIMSMDLNEGDEVIVPSTCYISPIHVLKLLKLKPIICEMNSKSFQMDPFDIEKKITKKTKLILMIHNYGNLCEVKRINNIAKKYKIMVLEDFAEAIFSKLNNTYAGKFGKISCCSFHATKTLTTGEGGMVFTDSLKLFSKMKKIREHGYKDKSVAYSYEAIGLNFKMSNILASIGLAQLFRKKKIISKRVQLYKLYKKNLKNNKFIIFPKNQLNEESVMWSAPINILINKKISAHRLMKILKSKKIDAKPSFKSLTNNYHLKLKDKKKTHKSNNFADNILLLPLNSKMSTKKVLEVCKTINSAFNIKKY